MIRISALFHVPFEQLGGIEDWIVLRGHAFSPVHLYQGDPLPQTDAFDMLVIMGGPMGANSEENHSWLADEKQLIRQSIAGGKTLLGICLGAQLIASALGSKVYRAPVREIGWYPIQIRKFQFMHSLLKGLPDELTTFHWHGDTFDIPHGALLFASSAAVANQAFLYGNRVMALQFHAEMKPENIGLMLKHAGNELTGGSFVQSAMEIRNGLMYSSLNRQFLHTCLEFLESQTLLKS